MRVEVGGAYFIVLRLVRLLISFGIQYNDAISFFYFHHE